MRPLWELLLDMFPSWATTLYLLPITAKGKVLQNQDLKRRRVAQGTSSFFNLTNPYHSGKLPYEDTFRSFLSRQTLPR